MRPGRPGPARPGPARPTTGCLPTCRQPASIKTIVLIVIKMEQKNVWQQRAHWMIEFVVRLSPPSDLRIILYYGDSSGYGALHWNLTQEKLISYRWSFVQNFVNQSLKYKPLVGEGRARLDVGLMRAYKIFIKKLGRFSPKALSNSHKWARKRAVPSSRACFTHRVASLLRGLLSIAFFTDRWISSINIRYHMNYHGGITPLSAQYYFLCSEGSRLSFKGFYL